MKAIVFKSYGDPEVLQLEEIEKPSPKNNEVLVRIYATSVTAEDPKMRGFNHPPLLKFPIGLMFGFKKPKNPVLGIEFAGIIENVGSKVKNFKKGDQVFGYTGLKFGAYAQYKCLPENGLLNIKPNNLSFEEAACLVNGPLSALTYLKKKGKIKKGDHVLIYGASGSVGTAAVQLAKYFETNVTGVCSTKNVAMVKSIGADWVIDYTKQDFTQNGQKYDLIFDTVGKTAMKDCLKILNPKGKYLLTDFGLSHILLTFFTSLFNGKKVIVASSNFYWKREDLKFFKELAENGHLKPVIDKIFPLDQMINAHKYVELGHKTGNVSISVQ